MIPILLTVSQAAELLELKAREKLFKSTHSLLQKQCLAEAEDDVEKKREVGWRAHSSTRHCPAVHAVPKPRGWSCQQCVLLLTHHGQAVTARHPLRCHTAALGLGLSCVLYLGCRFAPLTCCSMSR